MKPDKSTLTDAERENLVAYLDNDLDEPVARTVEAKLNLDPAVRAEADQMKLAWDLLDYLPRPEPSPGFAGRTMSRLTALRPIEERRRPWRTILSWAAAFLCVAACGFAAYRLVERRAGPADTPHSDIARNLPLLQPPHTPHIT